MHELSICQALISQAELVADEHETMEIKSLVVGVGPLSGVDPQLLKQAFQFASVGTCVADSELIIESLPVRVHCQTCGCDTDVLPNRLICGKCGDWHTEILGGYELLLISVELENENKGEECATPAVVM